ncbi:hypothetical protein BDN72DRAFT_494535 [Pluteus cervinus]|uniref:Uncharacterized protein n=1 Tax=Pluteus cervinus TaxID=181527 RepID=A0ACD3A649_9AGAR|nr:hypothetical protein BDN72DRAFT_494535 [Pluteus cervinus]
MHSTVYRLAMVLHPRHKLNYFREHGWDDDWIKEAGRLFREDYAVNYAGEDEDGDEGSTESEVEVEGNGKLRIDNGR